MNISATLQHILKTKRNTLVLCIKIGLVISRSVTVLSLWKQFKAFQLSFSYMVEPSTVIQRGFKLLWQTPMIWYNDTWWWASPWRQWGKRALCFHFSFLTVRELRLRLVAAICCDPLQGEGKENRKAAY